MKRINAPAWDVAAELNEIVDSKTGKRGKRLLRLKPHLIQAYTDYLAQGGALAGLLPRKVGAVKSADLLHCYMTSTKPLKRLKQRLTSLVSTPNCPYCGVDSTTTLDHYLPKEIFPEFAVFAHNLIPCCFACNSKRGHRDWSPGRGPSAIHVFHEHVEESHELLKVEFSSADASVKLRALYNVVRDGSQFASRLAGHVSTLGLGERFSLAAAGVIDTLVFEIRFLLQTETAADAEATLREEWSRKSVAMCESRGANNWLAAFYRAAATRNELVEFLLVQGAVK